MPTALLLVLAAAAPATAAYAPKLSVKVTPSAPAQPAGFSSTVTQAASETPTRTAAVTLPPEMTLNPSSTATECTAAQESARSCPESSRLGNANAAAKVLGLNVPLTGTVHLGTPRASDGALHVIVFLDNGSFNQHPTIDGFITLASDGAVTTFDGLPTQATVTSFTLAFEASSRTLLTTPDTCGTFPIKAAFTSKNGEKASASDTFTIAGCPNEAPVIDAIRVVPVRMKRPAKAVVRVRVNEPGKLAVRVKKGRKTVKLTSYRAKQGLNLLKPLPASLKPARYTVSVRPTDAEGKRGEVETVAIRVLKKK